MSKMAETHRATLHRDSEITEISSHQDNGDGYWPPEPLTITRKIDGNLANRIRSRMGAPHDADVFIEEETCYGGYSEYTQENSTSFKIICNDRSLFFHVDAEETWDSMMGNHSVFARLQMWLQVGESPLDVWSSSMELAERKITENLSVTRWMVKVGSLMYLLIMGPHARPETDIAYITNVTNGTLGLGTSRLYANRTERTDEFKSLYLPQIDDHSDKVADLSDDVKISIINKLSDQYAYLE